MVACYEGRIPLQGKARGIEPTKQGGRPDAGKMDGVEVITSRNVQDVAEGTDHGIVAAFQEWARNRRGQDTDQVLESPDT